MVDVEQLLHALSNEDNQHVMKQTTRKAKTDKNNILQKLQIKGDTLKSFHKKLNDYIYVDELKDLKYGNYVRWIPLKDPSNLFLTNGGLLCDIKIVHNKLHLICKNHYHKFMQLKFDEIVLFQKLTPQEKIILKALDYLERG